MSDKRTETAQALIGQCLWDSDKINDTLVARVMPADMPTTWGRVWAIVKSGETDIQRIGLTLDPATLESVGGQVGLSELTIYGGGDHAGEYAEKLLNYTAKVGIMDVAEKMRAMIANEAATPDEIINNIIE